MNAKKGINIVDMQKLKKNAIIFIYLIIEKTEDAIGMVRNV